MTRRTALTLLTATGVSAAVALGWLELGTRHIPDFSRWPAGPERKAHFFDYLRPLIAAENQRILGQRRRLMRIAHAADDGTLGFFDRRWLAALAREYELDPDDFDTKALIGELERRVDAVPASLALAQAAKESAWGTSRFAIAGNALFGERCFERGCGIVPNARARGAHHEVRTFASPAAAVAGYLHNLNTHPDYESLRERRAELRSTGKAVTGLALAEELDRYSERREHYIQEVRQMIRRNALGPVATVP